MCCENKSMTINAKLVNSVERYQHWTKTYEKKNTKTIEMAVICKQRRATVFYSILFYYNALDHDHLDCIKGQQPSRNSANFLIYSCAFPFLSIMDQPSITTLHISRIMGLISTVNIKTTKYQKLVEPLTTRAPSKKSKRVKCILYLTSTIYYA